MSIYPLEKEKSIIIISFHLNKSCMKKTILIKIKNSHNDLKKVVNVLNTSSVLREDSITIFDLAYLKSIFKNEHEDGILLTVTRVCKDNDSVFTATVEAVEYGKIHDATYSTNDIANLIDDLELMLENELCPTTRMFIACDGKSDNMDAIVSLLKEKTWVPSDLFDMIEAINRKNFKKDYEAGDPPSDQVKNIMERLQKGHAGLIITHNADTSESTAEATYASPSMEGINYEILSVEDLKNAISAVDEKLQMQPAWISILIVLYLPPFIRSGDFFKVIFAFGAALDNMIIDLFPTPCTHAEDNSIPLVR